MHYLQRSALVGSLFLSGFCLAKPAAKDVTPTPPSPGDATDAGITKNAGVGSQDAYSSAGVLEIGGTAGFTGANKMTQFSLAPSVGWFFADNLELSGIFGWYYTRAAGASEHLLNFLVEPSYHYPLSKVDFVFLGVGLGFSFQSSTKNGGLALAPRFGYQKLIGRSGLMTVALQTAYSGNDMIRTSQGTLLTVQSATSLTAGFSVLW
jgi:hypothetical protein